MDLGTILQYSYPGMEGAYRVMQDADGTQTLTYWNVAALGPQPTSQQLLDMVLPAAKVKKRRELLLSFKAEYALIWLIDGIDVPEQKDSILGKTAAQRTANETALVNQANTLIIKVKSKLVDVNNATTEAAVGAITWA